MMKNWVLLAEYASTLEAEMAAARLRDAGLHVLTNSPASGVYSDPATPVPCITGVRMFVPADELESARLALDISAD